MSVNDIKALTKSSKKGNPEFVVHIKKEYDYLYESQYIGEIFDAIKYVFWKQLKTNVPIYQVPDKLKNYHTSKKLISQG